MSFTLWVFINLLLQVSTIPDIWEKLAEHGTVALLMGTAIVYLIRRIDRRELEFDKKLEQKDEEIKTLYELQSKEYLASLNIMAAAADSNKKLKELLDEQPESLKAIRKESTAVRIIVEEIYERTVNKKDK